LNRYQFDFLQKIRLDLAGGFDYNPTTGL